MKSIKTTKDRNEALDFLGTTRIQSANIQAVLHKVDGSISCGSWNDLDHDELVKLLPTIVDNVTLTIEMTI